MTEPPGLHKIKKYSFENFGRGIYVWGLPKLVK